MRIQGRIVRSSKVHSSTYEGRARLRAARVTVVTRLQLDQTNLLLPEETDIDAYRGCSGKSLRVFDKDGVCSPTRTVSTAIDPGGLARPLLQILFLLKMDIKRCWTLMA